MSIRLGEDGADDSLAQLSGLLEASDWAKAALRRAIAKDEHEAAVRWITELVVLGADVERRGSSAAQRIGGSIHRMALSQLPTLFESGSISIDEARALARVLDRLEPLRPQLLDALEIDRAWIRGLIAVQATALDSGMRNTGLRHLWSGKLYRAATLEEWDSAVDRLREILHGADGDPARARQDAERAANDEENALRRLALVGWPFDLKQAAAANAAWRVARTALAISIYTREKGAAPPTLPSLVPAYLPRVPIDPRDAKPLRYDAGPPARVWSIGRDEKDDGGKLLEHPDYEDQPGDFVIATPAQK
jgi:hypothetical protein